MNIVKKITLGTLGLAFISSTISAQSFEDAKKAVNAEQLQKAKSIFNSLVQTQPTPENLFYFGDLYLQLNRPDSAKILFTKGVAADEKGKYPFNNIGLGAVKLFEKDNAGAQAIFAKVVDEMKKKDYAEYIYIGKSYTYEATRDLTKAFEWFEKAKENGEKDVNLHVFMGNAYKALNKNSEAVAEYQRAMNLQDNLLAVEVNIGEIWTQAFNFDLSESTLKGVIAKDPNFGPAYRALAENYYRWASGFPNRKSDLLPLAKDNYSKYLDLTDRSTDSRYRYLIFLFNAGDFATLEKEANDFINSPAYNKNFIIAKRFRGYAAVENGNSEAGIKALESFTKEVEKTRVNADDYLKMGKAYTNLKNDSLAILSYIKGFELDTTNTEILKTIASSYWSARKFDKAAEYYDKVTKLPNASFVDWFYLARSHYFQYANLIKNNSQNKELLENTLIKADSAFTYVAVAAKNADAYLYVARVEYYLNPVQENIKVKEASDKVVELITAKPEITAVDKRNLAEAYSYIGQYYIKSDKAKALANFNKVLEYDPNNQQVKEAIAAIKAS
jgi:tetratricopeptide (TPR) repeat protein